MIYKYATTLGQDLISKEDREILLNIDKKLKDIVKEENTALKNKDSPWSFYPRAMYNSNQNIFDDNIEQRINNVLNYCENLSFNGNKKKNQYKQ